MADLVIIESPYAGDIARNIRYARAAVRDSLQRDEAPIASHLLYTQPGILDDNDPDQRRRGIDAGISWARVADLVAVYIDLGYSPGMRYAVEIHRSLGRRIEERSIPFDGRPAVVLHG